VSGGYPSPVEEIGREEARRMKVLFAGEAIYSLTTIYKGRNSFSMGRYEEHGGRFIEALEKAAIDCDHIPTHRVAEYFPWTIEELKAYDVIVVSDVGSDTFLISKRTMDGERTPNRLNLIRQYVQEGGGFVMWGGYLSFTGFQGKGFYKDTPVEEILPVTMMDRDDRRETPEGFLPAIKTPDHPILSGMPRQWEGWFLSYNRFTAKEGATVIAAIDGYGGDPFLAAWDYGKGRTVASAVDCAHHGAAPSFLKWEFALVYFANIVKWCARLL
jgi:uncharacterized membrane protein